MKKYIVLLICMLGLLGCSNNTYVTDNYSEEVNPIREGNTIVGINYNIILNDNNIKDINTKIIDSIYHYKDISLIDSFFIRLNIYNNSEVNYYLKGIDILNYNNIVKKYNYNELVNNSVISIKLNKSIINRISNNIDKSNIIIIFEKDT